MPVLSQESLTKLSFVLVFLMFSVPCLRRGSICDYFRAGFELYAFYLDHGPIAEPRAVPNGLVEGCWRLSIVVFLNCRLIVGCVAYTYSTSLYFLLCGVGVELIYCQE